jgi:limonene-1,2-epoxide hydrolase
MFRFCFVALMTALLAVGCGGGGHHATSPESVARAWSAALDRNDNTAAGALFAAGATIVQNGELTLRTRADAVQWNALLPCGGKILSVQRRNATDVLVVFLLGERPHHRCDGPGQKAAAIFRVRHGKIVLWHQTGVPQPTGTPAI